MSIKDVKSVITTVTPQVLKNNIQTLDNQERKTLDIALRKLQGEQKQENITEPEITRLVIHLKEEPRTGFGDTFKKLANAFLDLFRTEHSSENLFKRVETFKQKQQPAPMKFRAPEESHEEKDRLLIKQNDAIQFISDSKNFRLPFFKDLLKQYETLQDKYLKSGVEEFRKSLLHFLNTEVPNLREKYDTFLQDPELKSEFNKWEKGLKDVEKDTQYANVKKGTANLSRDNVIKNHLQITITNIRGSIKNLEEKFIPKFQEELESTQKRLEEIDRELVDLPRREEIEHLIEVNKNTEKKIEKELPFIQKYIEILKDLEETLAVSLDTFMIKALFEVKDTAREDHNEMISQVLDPVFQRTEDWQLKQFEDEKPDAATTAEAKRELQKAVRSALSILTDHEQKLTENLQFIRETSTPQYQRQLKSLGEMEKERPIKLQEKISKARRELAKLEQEYSTTTREERKAHLSREINRLREQIKTWENQNPPLIEW